MSVTQAASAAIGNFVRAGFTAACSTYSVAGLTRAARSAWRACAWLSPSGGAAERGLRRVLKAKGVSVLLSSGCIHAFATEARAEAIRAPSAQGLSDQIEVQASFIERWTASDQVFEGLLTAESVRIARRYALPRGWRLPDSVAKLAGGGSTSAKELFK